jgi:hypothetical protein
MRILFDFELEEYPPKWSLSSQHLLDEVRSFIGVQLNDIEDDLSAEEENKGACIIIGVLDRTFNMYYYEYSPEIIAKIRHCFPPEKRNELNARLTTVVQILSN